VFTTLTATSGYQGAASGPLNGTVGATTPNTGVFTTLTATSGYQGAASGPLNGTVGATTPNTGAFTTITASSTLNVTGTAAFAGTVTAATVNALNIGNSGALLTGTIQTAAQPNITSLGTLTLPTINAMVMLPYNLDPSVFNAATYGGGTASSGRGIIGWNRSAGQGEMSFIQNQDGGSPGGFIFYNWANTSTNTTTAVFGIDSTGIVTARNNIIPSANVTYNLGSTTANWSTVYAVTFAGTSTTAKYADLAENYLSDQILEPGDVVVFGGNAEITSTTISHDTRVAGVISTNPAYLMNSDLDNSYPVAMTGRVPCRVMGPVKKGDVLVAGSTEKTAERIDNTKFFPGCVLGKSLEDIDQAEIRVIEVVVGKH
jgi:hypothetical protein